jgi:hypothetical protein
MTLSREDRSRLVGNTETIQMNEKSVMPRFA